jgi:GT2 family glycosyltransferase
MSVSVIICAYSSKRLERLDAAIRSALYQDLADVEVIVVIDHNAALLETVAVRFPGVKVVPNEGVQGLSDARNTGVAQAGNAIIAFLDDDAVADPSWLSRLTAHYADPKVIAVGGGIVPVWPNNRPHWFPPEFDWVIGCSYRGLPETVAPVRNLIGCNMSMRRHCITAVGGFKTDLGRVADNAAGCEETEFFIRLKDRFTDGIILLDPVARVRHFITQDRTRWTYFVGRCQSEGCGKALMAGLVKGRQHLSSETAYVRRVLPKAILWGLSDAVRGDMGGLARSGAIVLGFGITAAAYLKKRLRLWWQGAGQAQDFAPLRIVDADLSQGLPDLLRTDPTTGQTYGGAWCLIRNAGQPVKIMEVPLDQRVLSSDNFRALVMADGQISPPPPLSPAIGPKAPHVTVVIATRDRAQSLRRCLDSLLVQTYPKMDIVVVDNAPSSAETFDLIETTYAPTGRVTYVLEKKPGLARAHNAGIAAATGEVIAFTDDDVIVDPSWVSAIAANFASSNQIGCVTGLILPAELETRAQYWTEGHGGFGKGLTRTVFDPARPDHHGPLFPYAAGAFGSGANMAFRRATLARMGGFDAALGAGTIARGGDDLSGFFAVLQSGDQIAYEPGAIVWHHHRRSEEGMRRQAYGYGVGLGAYLTKLIVENPARIVVFLCRFPAALRHLFSRKSGKLDRLPHDYPTRLVWSERWGIVMGIPAYLRSLHALRQDRARLTAATAAAASAKTIDI